LTVVVDSKVERGQRKNDKHAVPVQAGEKNNSNPSDIEWSDRPKASDLKSEFLFRRSEFYDSITRLDSGGQTGDEQTKGRRFEI
jgi:hypothetical protein